MVNMSSKWYLIKIQSQLYLYFKKEQGLSMLISNYSVSVCHDMVTNAPSSLHLPISFYLETCNTLTYHIQKKQVFFDHMHHCQQLSTILSSSCSME